MFQPIFETPAIDLADFGDTTGLSELIAESTLPLEDSEYHFGNHAEAIEDDGFDWVEDF